MTWLLAVKLVATPVTVGLASLAGRRWGPGVSGWIAGIPLTSGPLAIYLALEQGTAFAAVAAAGILTGLIAVAAFCLVYARMALRLPWGLALVAALGAFGLTTAVLESGAPALPLAAVAVTLAVLLALSLMPRSGRPSVARATPAWDIPARMLVATVIVVGLTAIAPVLGARLAGLLAPVPVYAGLMTVFAHRLDGGSSAVEVLRGVLYGVFGFGAFFGTLAATLTVAGIVAALLVAMVLGLATQVTTLWLLSRLARAPAGVEV
jgi:hypothetical protein